ncbi:MAG: CDP-alcohol phosphatidyltransferase family protein [Rhodospirillaceae bacterium]|nr:CDP-alcohol phosphatidyltransferase family protein [Rhodospirillaceae bacterium]
MFDPIFSRILKAPLARGAEALMERNITATQVTLGGFAAAVLCATAVAYGYYVIGLLFLIVNRIADGLDGTLARMTQPTDFGAYLDMVLDFVAFTAIAASFAAGRPEHAIPAVVVAASLMGLASTFLGFAVVAATRGLIPDMQSKPFNLAGGIVETSEITVFLLVVLVSPDLFPTAAWVFSAACWVTMAQRIFEARATFERG